MTERDRRHPPRHVAREAAIVDWLSRMDHALSPLVFTRDAAGVRPV